MFFLVEKICKLIHSYTIPIYPNEGNRQPLIGAAQNLTLEVSARVFWDAPGFNFWDAPELDLQFYICWLFIVAFIIAFNSSLLLTVDYLLISNHQTCPIYNRTNLILYQIRANSSDRIESAIVFIDFVI